MGYSRLSLPTDRSDWHLMGRTVRRVLASPVWLTVAFGSAILTVSLFVGLDAPVYVRRVVLGGERPILVRLLAMVRLFPLVGASDSLLRETLIYATAAAVGTNLAVLGQHLRRDSVRLRDGSSGLVGVVIGTLGAGCAPCGAAVLAGALSVTGVAAGLAALPLKGAEFLVIALATSVLSLFWVADGAAAADVEGCPVDS